jgi:GDP-D-mannose dehydratase
MAVLDTAIHAFLFKSWRRLESQPASSGITSAEPDEVYNLGAQSVVTVSFSEPAATAQISALGAIHLLEAIRIVNPAIRYYQASAAIAAQRRQKTARLFPQHAKIRLQPYVEYCKCFLRGNFYPA